MSHLKREWTAALFFLTAGANFLSIEYLIESELFLWHKIFKQLKIGLSENLFLSKHDAVVFWLEEVIGLMLFDCEILLCYCVYSLISFPPQNLHFFF